ncbi:MAG: WG repeat-containing protein [Bacteroidota bacterium]
MKSFLVLVLLTLVTLTKTIGQPINFKIYSPTGGFLKIMYGTNKKPDTTYYLKNNKLVASLKESDIYVKAGEHNDTIRISSFYTANEQPALNYTLVRKGKELQYVDYSGYEPSGELIGYAHNLNAGKGILLVKDRDAMGVEIYRGGNKIAQYGLARVEQERLIVFPVGNVKKSQGVLNMEGDVVIPVEYDLVRLEEHVFIVKNDLQKWGAFDINGKALVPFDYDDLIPRENMVVTWINVRNNDKENYGLYDKEGNMITAPVNPLIDFSAGPMPVMGADGNYGFVDENAKMVTPFEYKYVRNFSDGLAAVANQKGEFGFIDNSGKLVVPYKFFSVVMNFENGKARVSESRFKKAYAIDKQGNKIVDP